MNISQTIAKIWEKVLNIQDINPNDNFFDLGGSSREALEILYEVELQLNIKLSISSIFSNPSLGEFCSYCSKFSSVETENTVVEQSIACHYFYPLVSGQHHISPFFAFAFAPNFEDQRPVYYSPGIYEKIHGVKENLKLGDIYNIVDSCVEEIIKLNPTEDYLLGGFCHGSWIALSIANKLIEKGKKVVFLGLIESYPRKEWFQSGQKNIQKLDYKNLKSKLVDYLYVLIKVSLPLLDIIKPVKKTLLNRIYLRENIKNFRQFEKETFDMNINCKCHLFVRSEFGNKLLNMQLYRHHWSTTVSSVNISIIGSDHMGVRNNSQTNLLASQMIKKFIEEI